MTGFNELLNQADADHDADIERLGEMSGEEVDYLARCHEIEDDTAGLDDAEDIPEEYMDLEGPLDALEGPLDA